MWTDGRPHPRGSLPIGSVFSRDDGLCVSGGPSRRRPCRKALFSPLYAPLDALSRRVPQLLSPVPARWAAAIPETCSHVGVCFRTVHGH